MNILFVSLNRQEKRLGWPCFVLCTCLLPLVFGLWDSALSVFLEAAISCTAVVLIFRSFLEQSLHVPLTTPGQILLKVVLGLVISFTVTLFMNDITYFYLPQYFTYTDYGPMYYNVNEAAMAACAGENFLLTAFAMVVLIPVAEEVLFRGLLFGSILPKCRALAFLVSVGVFAFLPTLGLIGQYPTVYIVINFWQYVPLGFVLGWVYTSTETILTPILLRMALHALSICSMR